MCHDLAPALSVHTKKQHSTVTQLCTVTRCDSYDFFVSLLNTLRTGDADLRFYITAVQDG